MKYYREIVIKMKKLVYTLLVSTALATSSLSGVYAGDVTTLDEVQRSLDRSSVASRLSSEQKHLSNKVSMDQNIKSSVPGKRVNFLPEEADEAVLFADLAYKQFKSKFNADEKTQYSNLLTHLQSNGWKGFKSFNGTTGHSILPLGAEKETEIGLLAKKDHKLMVALRGTDVVADLVTDLHVLNGWGEKSRFSGAGVHAGINKVFKSYMEELTAPFLASLKEGVTQVTVCGHSLGGGLAQLTALHLKQYAYSMGYNIECKVASFNSPRVGSKNFAELVNNILGEENIAIFHSEGDIVHRILLGVLGFKHAGMKIMVQGGSWWNKAADHSLSVFKNGAAGNAVIQRNAMSEQPVGIRTQISQTTVGKAVFGAARYIKDNALNPAKKVIKESVTSVKTSIASQLTIKKQTEQPANDQGIRAQIRSKVNSAINYVKEAVPQMANKAKESFVAGFQKIRSGIAGFFGL